MADARTTGEADGAAPRLLLPLLLALPAAVLALPWPLAFDPLPHAAATGWALLATLPAALALPLLAGTRPLPGPAALLLVATAAVALALAGDRASDTFELRRASLLFLVGATLFVGGTRLGRGGRACFGDLTVLASLAFSGQALLGSDAGGPLGNTGALSQAALPGAVVGALALSSASLPRRVLGGAAALAFAVHAGTTPVIAGAGAFAAAIALAFVLARAAERRARALPLAAALLAVLLVAVTAAGQPDATRGLEGTAPDAPVVALDPGAVGGGAVRTRIWSRVPSLVATAPWAGVGPGQFQAAFPPHRDPVEVELSTHGRAEAAGVEVEHAHSDWLEVFVELGILGGGALVVLFAFVVARAARLLRRAGEGGSAAATDAGLAAAAVAILANGVLHCPLAYNPSAAAPAWTLFGAVLVAGARPAAGTRRARALPRLVAAVLALVALWPGLGVALDLRAHGARLAERQRLTAELEGAYREPLTSDLSEARVSDAWLEEDRLLRRALDAAPDSPLARSLLAQHLRAGRRTDAARERALDAWRAVLRHRPHQVSALLGAGLLTDDGAERRALWEHAFEIDPGHPIALSNLARLELFEGDPARGLAYLERLGRTGTVDAALLVDLGSRALLAGRTDTGLELLERAEVEGLGALPEELYSLSEQERARNGDTLLADALEAAAHRRWGLQNLALGEPGFAIAKFRQALRTTRAHLPAGDSPTRLLLAAALVLADRVDEARAELDGLGGATEADGEELPEEAREALRSMGYEPGSFTGS